MPAMSDDTVSKGVLDSIKNMIRKPKAADTGSALPAAALRAEPAPYTRPRLSGQADDHDVHAQHLTHLLQHNPHLKPGSAGHAALTHVRRAHDYLAAAHKAYADGDDAAAHSHLMGAKAHLHHSEALSARDHQLWGSVPSARAAELHHAIVLNRSHAQTMSKGVLEALTRTIGAVPNHRSAAPVQPASAEDYAAHADTLGAAAAASQGHSAAALVHLQTAARSLSNAYTAREAGDHDSAYTWAHAARTWHNAAHRADPGTTQAAGPKIREGINFLRRSYAGRGATMHKADGSEFEIELDDLGELDGDETRFASMVRGLFRSH